MTIKEIFTHAVGLKRPHESISEARFVGWLANRLPVTMIDGAGNLHVDLRRLPSDRTLFTAHTDTVHWDDGPNETVQQGATIHANGDALGADDAAGIALLHHMIAHRVSGYYVFFRGEERGGVGSKWLASSMPDLLCEFDHAVAFDRAGYHDIITHQGGQRCCSDEFAQALAEQLSADDFSLAFAPCDTGVYTDTKEFVELIPECTNVSVGYFKQHTSAEYQDMAFLEMLAQRVLEVNWSALPVERSVKALTQPYEERKYMLELLYDIEQDPQDTAAWRELAKAALGDEFVGLTMRPKKVKRQTIRNAIELVEGGWSCAQVAEMLINEAL